MTTRLESLKNTTRPAKRRKLLGRGPGSKRGKTSGRGEKGEGSRSGYKRRMGYIGGGVPIHKSAPTRGFSNARFARRLDVVNLDQIDKMYADGETVSLETLRGKGFISGSSYGVKVLGNGELTKKVTFQVEAVSKGATIKIQEAGIPI